MWKQPHTGEACEAGGWGLCLQVQEDDQIISSGSGAEEGHLIGM